MSMSRVLHVSPYTGLRPEPDHTLDETKSLLRFLRPINPDAVRTIALQSWNQKTKPPLSKE